MLVTPGGLARLLIRSCQAVSAADLALSSGDAAADGGGLGVHGEGGGSGVVAGTGATFLSGGAEGDMTAAIRMLHELGPSAAGRWDRGRGRGRPCYPAGRMSGGVVTLSRAVV